MTSNPMFFDICPQLVARSDFSHTMDADRSAISGASCKMLDSGQPCPFRGACVTAKSHNTGRPIGAVSRR
jgi:hypothetical protein